MILPDPGQEDIPIEIISKNPIPVSPYFRQLAAIISVLVLTVGLGLAVKLSQENQGPSKAGSGLVDRVDLSVNQINPTKYGLSAQAVGSAVDGVSYQWGVSSSNSIGTLNIHSSNKYAEFTLNGNQGRADIWVAVDGGVSNSYAITIGPYPISWKSRTAWFKADNFYFTLAGQTFTGQPDTGTAIKIDNVSVNRLSVSWTELGIPLNLSIFYNEVPEFDSEKINYAVSKLTISNSITTDTYHPVWTTRGGYPFETTKEEALQSDSTGVLYLKNIYWFPGLYDFEDLDSSKWSWKHVQKILPTRIMPPVYDGMFAPSQEITRADMALFLARAYEYITQTKATIVETAFTDIGSQSPNIQEAIKKIYGLKITAGTSTTTYSPDTKVNRAQMATFLSNLYKAVTGEFAPEVPVPFIDIYGADITWAQKPIARIYGLKVTAGISPTEFGPYQVTTREQMATFIMNFIEALSRVTILIPTPTPTPMTPSPVPLVTGTPKPTITPIMLNNLTSSISAITQQLLTPPPSIAPTLLPVPEIVIPQTATPRTTNIFIQIINLVQNFFRQILGLP